MVVKTFSLRFGQKVLNRKIILTIVYGMITPKMMVKLYQLRVSHNMTFVGVYSEVQGPIKQEVREKVSLSFWIKSTVCRIA